MPDFRRYYVPDAIVFITCVTNQRFHYLENPQDTELFAQTVRNVQKLYPFHLLAYVVLPDHFHWLMQMKDSKSNFSEVLHSTKRNFTKRYKNAHHITGNFQLWQPRFWDHIIRDEMDLERHFDYIHWNPVKHQVAPSPDEWRETSLHEWIRKGYYPASWPNQDEPSSIRGLDIGE